ncbi:hypothetical protein HHE02_14120 [Helicobacter heilmannii]|uniref:hypothetical protein n=1 Tax=Helicobacter heilmannii TaxID=35817 RepID=UPI0006A191DE|nr:hypothetical protein [Helicobacter heilmannii]CRF48102.1 hypothetical protein HHE02_14120 [Helicobacter heilmannii]
MAKKKASQTEEELQEEAQEEQEAAEDTEEQAEEEQEAAEAVVAHDSKGTCKPDHQYAVIQDNRVVNIINGADLPVYNRDDLKLIELQKGKEKFYGVGSVVVNGVLQPLDLATAKRKGLEELNAVFDEKAAQMQEDFTPFEEVLTYELQYQEAQEFNQDNTAPTPFLDTLSQSRGEDKKALVSKILQKHQDYTLELAKLMGKRHKLRDKIQQAKNLETLFKVAIEL